MSRLLKGLAILALLVTVAGACAVLYGINTLTPQVEQVSSAVTPAAQNPDAFDRVMEQLEDGTFAGRVFGDTQGLSAESCAFVTYTVRLSNRGFFPAEWISMEVVPREGTDILMLADTGAHVLGAGSRGDLTATLLCAGEGEDTGRQLTITCYVFGQKIVFDAYAS
ncbi:MAG TPA: hypothetical protein IAC49_02595 [Candidatus Ventricola intestinavium]|nr:hypothetical protein [Candidatus Ventricola intestinavium]